MAQKKVKKNRYVITLNSVRVDISPRQFRLLHLESPSLEEAKKAVGRHATQCMNGLVTQKLARKTRLGIHRSPWGAKILKAFHARGEKL